MTFLIAEIGINHNGDLGIAKQLIMTAKSAGCDAVKFQKRSIDKVYTQEFLDSPRESPWGKTQRDQKEGLEFGFDEYSEINSYCLGIDIPWFASAWDADSQYFLRKFKLIFNKIASPMLTNDELLQAVVEEGRHTFISTGMSNKEELDRVTKLFRSANCSFELMHCVSTYPMKIADANLGRIRLLKQFYDCDVGYSGHEVGLSVSFAAIAAGANSLERHITLDRSTYGSDQPASLEIGGLFRLVKTKNEILVALSKSSFAMADSEKLIAEKLKFKP